MCACVGPAFPAPAGIAPSPASQAAREPREPGGGHPWEKLIFRGGSSPERPQPYHNPSHPFPDPRGDPSPLCPPTAEPHGGTGKPWGREPRSYRGEHPLLSRPYMGEPPRLSRCPAAGK